LVSCPKIGTNSSRKSTRIIRQRNCGNAVKGCLLGRAFEPENNVAFELELKLYFRFWGKSRSRIIGRARPWCMRAAECLSLLSARNLGTPRLTGFSSVHTIGNAGRLRMRVENEADGSIGETTGRESRRDIPAGLNKVKPMRTMLENIPEESR